MARDEIQAGIPKLNSTTPPRRMDHPRRRRRRRRRRRHKHKHKPDEVKEEMVVDALPKEEEEEERGKRRKKKRKKLVTVKLSDELMGYLRTKEVMAYLARETPRPLPIDPSIAQHMFVGQELRQEIAAQVHENREFDAFVLYQYRTKGYAEIQQEVTDDDDDDG
ncbi:Os10g0493700 [Oryza sativa Japonica Group]|uniref:Uncharacterized protein n=2 Tax=Oryza sativa subsp. japonica TaxID=39947 RepID=A0A8J8YDI7_ORYSJ|nr:hypothetical protein [Oryza sativa Japonica Group]AAP54413.1 hypothetical protein LOC_Os10g35120 [Oryza sativa Japonica Group]EAZ16534.1 hypothetical protein OsJ_32008 [Oryza sativa Japonica Group]KAF2914185.1 hypothetical protein DAI22_10g143300 [Oryza sativa Japonica Group]BAT11453.1 Os10g0493700 [Oryza sativa Japonica Group]